jgi:hypothetical protein
MKLPFGALASRGQSIAEREQANKQAQKQLKDKFDPYGGVGKAADPFQPAFGKYAMTTLNKLADDIIKAYEGDEEEGWKRIRTPGTQENQLWLQRSREISDIGTANQYEFKQYADLYADVVAGKESVDPETREALRKFLSAQDENGVPVAGVDPAEFRSMRHDLEGMISAQAYLKNFMAGLPKMVQSVAEELGRAKSVGGGRYAIEDRAKKEFEPALQMYAQEYSDASGGKITPEDAYEKFRKVFNDEFTRKVSTFAPKTGGGGGGGASGEGFRYTTSQSRPPQELLEKLRDPISGNMPSQNLEWPTVNLFDIVNKRGQTPYARVFVSETGDNVYLHPTRIMDVNGQKYIIGKETGMPRTQAQKDKDEKGKTPEQRALAREARRAAQEAIDNGEPVNVEIFKDLPDIAIPYNEQNAALIEGSFGLPMSEVDTMLKSTQPKRQGGGKADTTEADIKKAFPGAVKDPKHGWVAKDENGKWRKVTL